MIRAETTRAVLSRERDTNGAELQAARLRIAELEAEIGRASGRDALVSSLMTLPAFRAQLELDVERAQRYGRPLTIAIVDIDRFRYLNMKRGYATGDKILHAVGELLAERTRALDLTCRAGADEFVMLLSETPLGEAQIALERILVGFEEVEAGDQKGVSASAGIAGLRHGQTADSLLAQAAVALEAARVEGGGRVHVSDGSEDEPGQVPPTVGTNVEVVAALAQALEERDQYTGEHSESVVDLVERVAQALAMDEDEIKDVRTAALLHDIGKVGIPDEILHKPGPLDEREWEVMRQHPVIGERILRAIPGMGSDRPDRPPRARALGRRRLSRRARGRRDPARRADHPRLRRLPRDDLGSPLPQGDAPSRRDGRADGERRHPVRPRGRRSPSSATSYGRRQAGLATA